MAPKKRRKKRSSKKATKRAKRGSARKGKGPGVRLTDAQKKKRLDMLAEHGRTNSPNPWTAKRCADALDMKVGTWDAWKYSQAKKAGGKKKRGPGRPRKSTARSIDSLQAMIDSVKAMQAERNRLRKTLERVQAALAGVL